MSTRTTPRLPQKVIDAGNATVHAINLTSGEIAAVASAVETFTRMLLASGCPIRGDEQEDKWLISAYEKLTKDIPTPCGLTVVPEKG